MTDRPASSRMPTPKQMEKLANGPLQTPGIDDPTPDDALPAAYRDALLLDPRAAGKPWRPVQQMRLWEIQRELLRSNLSRTRWSLRRRCLARRFYGLSSRSTACGAAGA
jgi:hypothetical protein